MDNLVKRCLGSKIQKTESQVFEGRYVIHGKDENEIEFTSLELGIQNCKDVYESLDNFTQGVDKNTSEKTGRSFKELPSVLQFKLARFESDADQNRTVKVNTRFDYPYQLNLDRDNGKYLSTNAKRNIPNLYTLSSVIVHSGGVEDDNYFAIIRPTKTNIWLKLEDENITRVDIRRATDELFGGDTEDPPFKFQKATNAFMLIYVREDENATTLFNIDENLLTQHVNLKENEVLEASLMIVNVCLDSDHDRSCTFKIKKEATFDSFKEIVAEYYGVEEHRLRFYTSDTPSSLVLYRSYCDKVERVLKTGTVVVQFDTKPGLTGVCDMCPRRVGDDVIDMEEYGRGSTVNRPPVNKTSAKVTKRSSNRNR